MAGAWALGGSSVETATANRVPHKAAATERTTIPPELALISATAPGSVAGPGGLMNFRSSLAQAGAWEIPAPALEAYQRAAQIIDASVTTCHLPWELVAAIGRIESDHGHYGGSSLNADGVSTPSIFGPELDGRRGGQTIADTDGGQIDHDQSHDRAVGPMQFLPSTWSTVKVDADADGTRDPQDIDDAALAAAVYLCSGNENLATNAGQRAALLRYNGSTNYGLVVLRVMQEYSANTFSAVPLGSYDGVELPAIARPHQDPTKTPAADPADTGAPAVAPAPPSHSPAKPAKPAPGSAKPGLTSLVRGVAADPGAAVPQVLTTAEATLVCVAQGVLVIDLRALTTCVTDLLSH